MKMNRTMNKTYLLSIFAAVLMMIGCTKVEVMDVQGEVLAVKKVPKTAGSFQLPVVVKGNSNLYWKARPVSNWLHVADQNWKQNAYNLTVNYDSNESSMYDRNFARVGYVVVETYDGFVADTIVVMQRGITPDMKLESKVVAASETECEITFNSNLTDACRPGMAYTATESWVESIEYLGCGTHLLVKFAANEGAERQSIVKVSFTDAWGETTSAECVLTQEAGAAPEAPETPADPENPETPETTETPENPENPETPSEPSPEPDENVR